MPYKIVYRACAERDIWEIADYLSDHSMPAAEKFLREVKSRIEVLAEMPLMYPKIDPDWEYRKMVVGNYVVAYIVDEQSKDVVIIRVVHGKRNYQDEIPPGR
jgi:plasmid stabilization system protein ParE